MCGIAGFFNYNKTESEFYLKKILNVLSHRGPDDSGIYIGDDIALGHNRLSIIDHKLGNQPMISLDKKFIIILNGEIYNYLELRQELIQSGFVFRTFSDTEVLLNLFIKYKEDCLSKLNGMFSFAIYDIVKHELFAARDPLGIKPFYFFKDKDNLIFASELKAFKALDFFDFKVNRSALSHYLNTQLYLNNETLVEKIIQLEPGNFLKINKNRFEIKKYWDLRFETDFSHDEEYFRDMLLPLLEDSVKINLRSDVKVATYLSGGIDSSIVSILASQFSSETINSYCGRFSENKFDESEYAREVAKNSNINLKLVDITPDDFVNNMNEVIYALDNPIAGPGSFAQFIVSKKVSESEKVILGGQGGDEIFSGYARYLVAYLEQAIKGAIFETNEEGNHIVSLKSIIPNLNLLKNYVPMIQQFWKNNLFDDMDLRYFSLVCKSIDMNELIKKEYQELLYNESIMEDFKKIFNSYNTPSYLNKMLAFDTKILLPSLLQVEDRVSMFHSLETRVPLIDTRIIELITKIPPGIKFKGGNLKYLLKETVKNILPRTIIDRKDKMGFPVPINNWIKENNNVRDFVIDTLTSSKAVDRGIHDVSKIDQLIFREKTFDRRIWALLSLELWQKNFIDN